MTADAGPYAPKSARPGDVLAPVVRRLLTGLIGTTVMTATMGVERVLRAGTDLPVDYDATGHVVTAAATVLRYRPQTRRGSHALFLLVHWGYGSAVALAYRPIRHRTPQTAAAAFSFFALCQSMAFAMFPTLGDTPPPWRWRRDIFVSSLAQHAVYATTVAACDRSVARRYVADSLHRGRRET